MDNLDSPKCPGCLAKGLVAQTYRIAGKQSFHCHDCKTIFTKVEFDEEAFLWKKDPGRWKAWLMQKNIDADKVAEINKALLVPKK